MKEIFDFRDENILWEEFKLGNKGAFNTIFRRYYSDLYFYGLKILPDSNFIKECIQDIFVRVWETRENLGEVKNIKSYLLISLRRKILSNTDKKRYNHTNLKELESNSFLYEENEFEKHTEISNETRLLLLNAVNSLTKKQREIIMLLFYHGLPYTEISKILNISIEAARNLTYRSLIHLRKILGNKTINALQNIIYLLFPIKSKKSQII
jgi:RNA polymerase sigma factor (sigma-70 family)